MDRGQSGVASAGTVATLALEMVEEAGDQRRVKIGQIQCRGRERGLLGGVAEQQSQGVAVGGDGLFADVSLSDT